MTTNCSRLCYSPVLVHLPEQNPRIEKDFLIFARARFANLEYEMAVLMMADMHTRTVGVSHAGAERLVLVNEDADYVGRPQNPCRPVGPIVHSAPAIVIRTGSLAVEQVVIVNVYRSPDRRAGQGG